MATLKKKEEAPKVRIKIAFVGDGTEIFWLMATAKSGKSSLIKSILENKFESNVKFEDCFNF